MVQAPADAVHGGERDAALAELPARPGPRRRLPRLTLDGVWLAIAVAYPFAVLNFSPLTADDGDFWWTLALGRAVWAAGALPAADPLALTPTPTPYYYAQWLAGWLLYGTWRLGGFELLLVLRAALVAVTFGLVYRGCRATGAAPALAGLCTLLALPLVNVGLSLRPQILALVPFTLYLEATRHPLRGGRWRWLLPLVMVFWANVHGSFLFGIALVALALAGRAGELLLAGQRAALRRDAVLRWLAVLLALSVAAPLVNPYGLGLLSYLRDYLAVNPGHLGLGDLQTEWLPTSLTTPGGLAYYCSLAALAIALLLAGWRLAPAEWLRLAAFGLLAQRWIRGIVWWGLVMPAPLAGLLQRRLGGPVGQAPAGRPLLNGVLLALALVVATASLPWWRAGDAPLLDAPVVQPGPLVGAADWLAVQAAPAPLFAYIAWGPYLAWRLDSRLFVDGRYEAYPAAVFADYLAISEARPDWEARLAAYGVERLALSRDAQPALVAAARASASWQPEYVDREVVVFKRADGR